MRVEGLKENVLVTSAFDFSLQHYSNRNNEL